VVVVVWRVLLLLLIAVSPVVAANDHLEDNQRHVFPGGIFLTGDSTGHELDCVDESPLPAPPFGQESCYCKAGGGLCCKDAGATERCTGGGGGGGGVTSISQGTGMSFSVNPITSTGTINLATPVAVTNGGTGLSTTALNDVLVGTAANTFSNELLPSCSSTSSILQYNNATQVFSCATTYPYSSLTGAPTTIGFDKITTGTNTTAAMTVGAGATLDAASTGTILDAILSGGQTVMQRNFEVSVAGAGIGGITANQAGTGDAFIAITTNGATNNAYLDQQQGSGGWSLGNPSTSTNGSIWDISNNTSPGTRNVLSCSATGPVCNLPVNWTVQSGATLGFTGTGVVNADQLTGTAVSATAPTNTQILIANATPTWQPETMSGDVTITNAGVTTIGKINGVAIPMPLLNTTLFSDVTAAAPVRGDLITAQTATPTWTRLAKGTTNQILDMTATDPAWVSVSQDASNAAGVWTNTGINGVSCLSGGDCLPQYLLLAGRSGGQSAHGGTAAADSLTLTGTANGSPTIGSTVDISGTSRFDGTYLTSTDSRTTFYANNSGVGSSSGNPIVTDSQLVELFRGTTFVGASGVIRGLSPRHFNGTTNGAKFVFTGNPNSVGSVEMFTEDSDYWNQQNTSITTGPFTAYGDGRRFNIDATTGNSPTFTINNGLAHAINSGVNTQGMQFTTTGTGTPTGTVQEFDGMELGGFAACQTPWTITQFTGQYQTSPGGTCTVTNETGMDLNLTQGVTRISTISRDAGTTMRHAGAVRLGDIAAPTHPLEITTSSSGTDIEREDATASITGTITGLNMYPGGLSIGSGGVVQSVIGGSGTWTMTANPGAFGAANLFTFTPTAKTANGTAITTKGVGGLVVTPTFQGDGATLTMQSLIDDALTGVYFNPVFNVINAGTVTADTVTALHTEGTISAGATVTNWTPIKIDAPTVTGTATNETAMNIGALTGGTATGISIGALNGSTSSTGISIGALASTTSTGISSTIASGASKLFINSTGTAASEILGPITTGSNTVPNAQLEVDQSINNNALRLEWATTTTTGPSRRVYAAHASCPASATTNLDFSLTANAPNDAPCPTSTVCEVESTVVCHCTSGTACTGDGGAALLSHWLVKNSAGTIAQIGSTASGFILGQSVASLTSTFISSGATFITSITQSIPASPTLREAVVMPANSAMECNVVHTITVTGT
jgi:hypothetical protein